MKHSAAIFLVSSALLITGCASLRETIQPVRANALFDRAVELERQGFYPEAILHFRASARTGADTELVKQHVVDIEGRMSAACIKHRAAGDNYNEKRSYKKAHDEYILAIASDPNCSGVFDALKTIEVKTAK